MERLAHMANVNEKDRLTTERAAESFKAKNPEAAERMAEALSLIDFDGLKQIFADIAKRAGVTEKINFIEREHVYPISAKNIAAGYQVRSNMLVLSGDRFMHDEPKYLETMPIRILYLVAHEETHATGAVSEGVGSGDPGHIIREAGFHRSEKIEDPYDENFFISISDELRLFNEGITDEIAHRVTAEYLRRSPLEVDGRVLNAAVYTAEPERFLPPKYATARAFATSLAGKIAEISGLPSEKVWEGLVAAYYRGEGLPRDLLDELVGPDFSKKIAAARTADDFQDIVARYKLPPIPPEQRRSLAAKLSSFLSLIARQ